MSARKKGQEVAMNKKKPCVREEELEKK